LKGSPVSHFTVHIDSVDADTRPVPSLYIVEAVLDQLSLCSYDMACTRALESKINDIRQPFYSIPLKGYNTNSQMYKHAINLFFNVTRSIRNKGQSGQRLATQNIRVARNPLKHSLITVPLWHRGGRCRPSNTAPHTRLRTSSPGLSDQQQSSHLSSLSLAS
jgi:hypothetical protein